MTATDDELRAIAFVGVEIARRHGKTWTREAADVAVRELAGRGDRLSTVLAKLESAANDPRGETPDAALWSKFGPIRAAAVPDDSIPCDVCGHGPEVCRELNGRVAPEHRHEYAPRVRRPADPRGTRLGATP